MSDTVLGLLILATAIAWIVAGCRRIYQLARYFQLEGYDTRRYLRWLTNNNRAQTGYTAFILAGHVLWFFSPVCFALLFLDNGIDELDKSQSLQLAGFLTAINLGLAVFAIAIRPSEREIKQPFTPTQRAMRLIFTAFMVDASPSILLTITALRQSSEVDTIFFTLLAGILTFHFAPLTLPLANLLMWPVEESFRRYYLRLAKTHLKRSGAMVIAITGSYGKTSTKHYLQHLLDSRYRVLMTPKSYNTLLGVSRVINEILANDASYDYFIVEAGAYIPGEIASICKLVEPRISMVTAVGPMHLERFGSMQNIVKAKYEIIEALPADGLAVFNGDDPNVRDMAERNYPQNRIIVSRQDAKRARLVASNVKMTVDGLDFDLRDTQTNEQRSMHTPLYGEHNVSNILMAAAVALHLGMSLAEIGMRVATLQPAEHRLGRRVMPDGTILIDDAYSANPVGTQMALEVLALHQNVRRIVISSGMFELGPIS
jgi:UDP-N-acetylmuramoyl-tripeptide--D-alanyl-D-alanine ligase